jgi:FMN phosphatase YigB (HAD superfamily)
MYINIDELNKINEKKILILDFDLTITDIHTNGRINDNMLYWNSLDNFNLIVKTLIKIKKSNNCKIYIVSRGIESDIKNYLKKLNIIELFDNIYGAYDKIHLSEPSHLWAKYKVEYITEIKKINNCEFENIFYIDDTQENIEHAISLGYSNSILLPTIGSSSIMLVAVLDKIYK